MLESARRRTKPRTVDLYDVFCGVLYLEKPSGECRDKASGLQYQEQRLSLTGAGFSKCPEG